MVLYAIFYRVTSLSVSINDRYLSVIQHYTRLPPCKTEKRKMSTRQHIMILLGNWVKVLLGMSGRQKIELLRNMRQQKLSKPDQKLKSKSIMEKLKFLLNATTRNRNKIQFCIFSAIKKSITIHYKCSYTRKKFIRYLNPLYCVFRTL